MAPTGWPAGWTGTGVPDGVEIDPELRWSAVLNLARLGRLDSAAIDAESDRDRTVTGAEQAAAAKAARPTAEAKAEAWRLAVEADDVPNGTQRAITPRVLAAWSGRRCCSRTWSGSWPPPRRSPAARATGPTKGYALRENVLRYLFPVPEQLAPFIERLDDWLARTDLVDSVRRPIIEGRDNAARALRCQQAG